MMPSNRWNAAGRLRGAGGRIASVPFVLLLGVACAAAAPRVTTAAPEALTVPSEATADEPQAAEPTPAQPNRRNTQEPDTRPGIAVLPFVRGIVFGIDPEAVESFGIGVQQILITELAQNTELRVVDRSVIRDILAEQDLVVSGRVDPETAARIGRLVGARYVITGSFHQDMDGVFRLDGRVDDVETSEVMRAERTQTRGSSAYYSAILMLGEQLTRSVDLPRLPGDVRGQRESRAAAIPREAVILYSQAQFFQDRGDTERARDLYVRITSEFPQWTEAAEALRQIGAS